MTIWKEKSKKDKEYEFKESDWPDEWIFQGGCSLEKNPTALKITSSNSGCLLKNYLWKDFEMEFKAKFGQKVKQIGIIFRAKNLENYFMLPIRLDNSHLSGSPHIRIEGNFETIENPVFTEDQTQEAVPEEDYFKVKLTVKDQVACLIFENYEAREWLLPTHSEPNIIQHLNISTGRIEEEGRMAGNVPKIIFREDYGRIGFRCYPDEEVKIKDLIVRPINNAEGQNEGTISRTDTEND